MNLTLDCSHYSLVCIWDQWSSLLFQNPDQWDYTKNNKEKSGNTLSKHNHRQYSATLCNTSQHFRNISRPVWAFSPTLFLALICFQLLKSVFGDYQESVTRGNKLWTIFENKSTWTFQLYFNFFCKLYHKILLFKNKYTKHNIQNRKQTKQHRQYNTFQIILFHFSPTLLFYYNEINTLHHV